MIEAVEAFTEAKRDDPSRNEDAFVVAEHFAAVIDGVTSLSEGTLPTSGRLAAQALVEAVRTLDPRATAREAVDALSRAVAEVGTGPAGVPRAAVAIVSAARRELWRVGDCGATLIAPRQAVFFDAKSVDALTADARALVLQAHLARGASRKSLLAEDPAWPFVVPFVEAQWEHANAVGEFGFGVIDGGEVPDAHLHVDPLGPEPIEIALYSDGFLPGSTTLAEAEAALSAALARDPLCIEELRGTKGPHPATGRMDDRTFVRVRLPGV
ncbi:hypothetical protein [Demequina pelophila]|uniref:hypothetical protein n=1 Tax=Demequina pelophila TaxID=1638984 RepID=UPI000784A04B|nr:hypothetical protein [Demequina pelophila]